MGVWLRVRVLGFWYLFLERQQCMFGSCVHTAIEDFYLLSKIMREPEQLFRTFSCLFLSVLIDPCVYIEYIEHILGWRTSKIKINVLNKTSP